MPNSLCLADRIFWRGDGWLQSSDRIFRVHFSTTPQCSFSIELWCFLKGQHKESCQQLMFRKEREGVFFLKPGNRALCYQILVTVTALNKHLQRNHREVTSSFPTQGWHPRFPALQADCLLSEPPGTLREVTERDVLNSFPIVTETVYYS